MPVPFHRPGAPTKKSGSSASATAHGVLNPRLHASSISAFAVALVGGVQVAERAGDVRVRLRNRRPGVELRHSAFELDRDHQRLAQREPACRLVRLLELFDLAHEHIEVDLHVAEVRRVLPRQPPQELHLPEVRALLERELREQRRGLGVLREGVRELVVDLVHQPFELFERPQHALDIRQGTPPGPVSTRPLPHRAETIIGAPTPARLVLHALSHDRNAGAGLPRF